MPQPRSGRPQAARGQPLPRRGWRTACPGGLGAWGSHPVPGCPPLPSATQQRWVSLGWWAQTRPLDNIAPTYTSLFQSINKNTTVDS